MRISHDGVISVGINSPHSMVRSVQVSTPSLMHVFIQRPSCIGAPNDGGRTRHVPACVPPSLPLSHPAPLPRLHPWCTISLRLPRRHIPRPTLPWRSLSHPAPVVPSAPMPLLSMFAFRNGIALPPSGPPQVLGFMNIYFIYIYIVHSHILITK